MTQAKHTPLQKRHPFSFSLGEGPYQFVGTYDLGASIRHQENFGDTAAAFRDAPRLEAGMGTCAHCGHAILTICIIKRGDGKLYGVGSDCVRKVAADGDVGAISQMERQLREDAKTKRKEKEQQKVADLMPDFQDALVILEKAQHPNKFLAQQGKTYADYFRFCSKNSKNMKSAINVAAAFIDGGAK